MKFVRLGGLSPVKYKRVPGDDPMGFSGHTPPTKHGIFAFPWPYIETFLCLYDEAHQAELKNRGFRHFKFDGHLYHHLDYEDLWTLDTIEAYQQKLKAYKHRLVKELQKDEITHTDQPIHDPFKRGLGGWYSRDSLEVFILKGGMGKIR